ncbi:MAG: TIGR00153 family protein [Mariprofundus sp.]
MVLKSSITSMFAGSPVKPLQEHMEKACACAGMLPDFVAAIAVGDFKSAKSIQQSIAGLETEADEIKVHLRMHLPNSLFMPMPREQVLDIVRLQDKIANISEDIAGTMIGRKMQVPAPLVDAFATFLNQAVDTANQARTAINELDELIEVGFRGRQMEVVDGMIETLEGLESRTDKMEKKLRKAMFEIEQDYPPLDMMFLYRIINWIGKLADVSHQVGARIQLLMAR